MPRTPTTPRIERLYQVYLRDQETAAFISGVGQSYLPTTLQRVLASGQLAARRGAALALGFLGDFDSNHPLGRALADKDRTVRLLAEDSIRKCWRRQGSDVQRQAIERICQQNHGDHFDEAARLASELIEQAPGLAEAWNQRAIARFHQGRLAEAIRDCHEALERNAYHFDAAAGMAQCFLELGEAEAALDCLRRALRLNPNLEGVRAGVRYLERRRSN